MSYVSVRNAVPFGDCFSKSQVAQHSVGRLRILGGGGGGGGWGPRGSKSQQAHDVVLTSMRRNDVASTSFRRHVPTRFLINQCQIITFLTVKSDYIEIEE